MNRIMKIIQPAIFTFFWYIVFRLVQCAILLSSNSYVNSSNIVSHDNTYIQNVHSLHYVKNRSNMSQEKS